MRHRTTAQFSPEEMIETIIVKHYQPFILLIIWSLVFVQNFNQVTINETAIASNLSFTNLTLNSSKNTNITSSNLTATSAALIINSGTSGTGSN